MADQLSEVREKLAARVRALRVGDSEEAILRLLRFMFSDDDGNWDEAAAQEWLRELERNRGGKV